MRFLKGDFQELKLEDISIDTKLKERCTPESEVFPSAEEVWTKDNIKSLSTTTTANRIGAKNSGKKANSKKLKSNEQLLTARNKIFQYDLNVQQPLSNKLRKFGNEITKEINGFNSNGNAQNDMNLSPPLARQLFTRHDLSAEEELIDSEEKSNIFCLENSTTDQNKKKFNKAILKKIIETDETPSSPSCEKENLNSLNNQEAKFQLNAKKKSNPKLSFKIRWDSGKQNFNKEGNIQLSIELENTNEGTLDDDFCIDQISSKLLQGLK